MPIRPKIKTTFIFSCRFECDEHAFVMKSYDGRRLSYKNHECSESVESEGYIVLKEAETIDKIPYELDNIYEADYIIPEGWKSEYNYKEPDDVICPKCVEELGLKD